MLQSVNLNLISYLPFFVFGSQFSATSASYQREPNLTFTRSPTFNGVAEVSSKSPHANLISFLFGQCGRSLQWQLVFQRTLTLSLTDMFKILFANGRIQLSLTADKAVMNNRNKVALLYGVNRIQIFTLKKHALVLEESLMRSTMVMGTIVNEHKFSLRINIFLHIARGYKKS